MSNTYSYKAHILRVVDGDTIDVLLDLGFNIKLKERIRLSGIDAPETRTRDLVEKQKGLAAKEWLENHTSDWGTPSDDLEIVIVTEEFNPTGKFGRVLGRLFVNGVDVNQMMLNMKLVKEYRK